jgi:hypothetical protein
MRTVKDEGAYRSGHPWCRASRGFKQDLGWFRASVDGVVEPVCWPMAMASAEVGWAYGLIERQREGLGLSFYQCRRRLIAGKLSLDLSPLLPVQVEAA